MPLHGAGVRVIPPELRPLEEAPLEDIKYDTSNQRSKSESKHTPIRLQQMQDASLFETVAEERGSSQKNILAGEKINIKKTMEVKSFMRVEAPQRQTTKIGSSLEGTLSGVCKRDE
ncbi:hypothetical protein BDV12DRAFT_198661 [Aspergillus spectabilis]